jgi:hypothetical protein
VLHDDQFGVWVEAMKVVAKEGQDINTMSDGEGLLRKRSGQVKRDKED